MNGPAHAEHFMQRFIAHQRVISWSRRHKLQIGGLPWRHDEFLYEGSLDCPFLCRQSPRGDGFEERRGRKRVRFAAAVPEVQPVRLASLKVQRGWQVIIFIHPYAYGLDLAPID